METFLRQIKKIKEEFNLKTDKAFEAEIGKSNKLNTWGKTVYGVDLDTLLTISKRFNKSLDWLLFNKESSSTLQEFTSEPYEARPLEALETILLFDVLNALEALITEKRQKLTLRQYARLASLVYDHCRREREKPSTHLVEKYLLLTD
jgi:hypothetical protein